MKNRLCIGCILKCVKAGLDEERRWALSLPQGFSEV